MYNFEKEKVMGRNMFLRFFGVGLSIFELLAKKNPVALLVINGIRAIISKKDDGISNKSVVQVVAEMGKSSWNDLDNDKVKKISDIVYSNEQGVQNEPNEQGVQNG